MLDFLVEDVVGALCSGTDSSVAFVVLAMDGH